VSKDRRIYVDFDDVLSETARAYATLLERHYAKTVTFDEMTSFDLGVSFGLNAQEYAHFMQLAHEPEVLGAFVPMGGAVNALEQFASMGFEIAVITGRPPGTTEVSRAWLDEHGFPYQQLVFVDKYSRAAEDDGYVRAITLGELAQRSFCFAIEDSGDMTAFLTETMALPVALLERPWNRQYQFLHPQAPSLVNRCVDWREIVECFEQLVGGR
jgi:uncharacterized HAD superfamily protein